MANSRSGGNANIDAKIMVPFTQASTLANLTSGENIKTSFGKISKFIDSIQDLVTIGTVLTGAVDLNNYTSSGIYNNGEISSIANSPTTVDSTTAFTLIVRNTQSKDHTSRIVQFLIDVNPTVLWTRSKQGSSAFSSWSKVFPIETSTTVQSGDGDPVTSDAVYQAISDFATFTELEDAIEALDVPASGTGAITGFGAGKTLASLTETDGKVNATFQDIDIVRNQVSDLFGVGTLLTSSNNLNSVSDGVYYYTGTSTPTNAPVGARATLIQFSNTDAGYPTQIVIPYAKTSMVFYIRRKSDDWGDWRTFESMANYDTEPTSDSVKAVQSGGLYTAFSNVNTALASKLENNDVFGLGAILTSTDNLNDKKTTGCYYWNNSSIPTNVPYRGLISDNGYIENATLYVIKNAYDIRYTQIVIPQGSVANAFGLYIRNSYSSGGVDTWTDWIYLEPTSHYDTTPTTDSPNACTSGGIASALSGKASMEDVLGSAATALTSSNDLDDISGVGAYYWVSSLPVNRPKLYGTTGSNLAYPALMYVFKLGGVANKIQMVIPFTATNEFVYFRYISSTPIGDWKAIQPIGEFDTTPTSGSAKGVTSGGVFKAIRDNAGGIGTLVNTNWTDLNTFTTPGRYYISSTVQNYLNVPLNGYEPGTNSAIGSLQLTVEQNVTTGRIIQTATFTPSHNINTHPARDSIACGHFWKRWLIPDGTPSGGSAQTAWTPWYQFNGDEPILEVSNVALYVDNTTDGVDVEIKGLGKADATVSITSSYVTYTVTHVPVNGTVPDKYILNIKSKGNYTGTTGVTSNGSATTTYNGQSFTTYFNVRLMPTPTGTNSLNEDEPI